MAENTERKDAPPASTATYGYDVDGRRVSRVVAGVETDYIYDLSGHVVDAYGGGCGSTCLNTAFVYANGQLLAQYNNGTTYFGHEDHLGSTRLLTGYPTASVIECDDYYPFGEQVSCGGTSTTTHKFTGYERDAESGLDNAQARYNSSAMGRFMSPDPVGNFVADATNPQTWNLYTYVDNNPLAFIDPSGLEGEGPPLRTLPSWFDCQPLIFMRGDPFDAEFPNSGSLFDTQSTFCGAGGDFARHIVDGGGIGGRRHGGGVCPLNSAGVSSCIAAPQTATPPKTPCTYLQNQAKGMKQLAEADHAITGPLLTLLFPAGTASVLGGLGMATGYACGTPEPGWPIACGGMIGVDVVGGGILLYGNYRYFKDFRSVWKAMTATSPPSSSDACGG